MTKSTSSWSPQHVWLVATYSMRFALRTGGGLTFLMLFLVVGLSVAAIFISPIEQMMEISGQKDGVSAAEFADEILRSDAVGGAVEWITGSNEEQSEYLLAKNPALLSAILLILLMIVPYTTCFGAFNQTSGDIGSRGLRYLLLRTERTNIFLGRFVGATLFTLASTLAVMAMIILYVQIKIGAYSGMSLWVWGAQGFIAIFFLTLPYIALCAWVSSLLDSAFASLAICMLFTGFSVVFLALTKMTLSGSMKIDGDKLTWMMKTIPWGWKYDLLHGNLGLRLVAIAAMLLFTGFFLLLGLRHFNKRDL